MSMTIPSSYQLTRPPHNDDEVAILWGMATDPYDRVMARLIKGDGCWVWPGSKTQNGYGTVSASPPYVDKRRPLLVHRVVYEREVGLIPEGWELDHLCRTRLCCRADHLEAVTKDTNVNRGERSSRGAKVSCIHGHPWPQYRYRPPNRKHYFCIGCFTPGGKRRGA